MNVFTKTDGSRYFKKLFLEYFDPLRRNSCKIAPLENYCELPLRLIKRIKRGGEGIFTRQIMLTSQPL
jgi:hypothetical protein